MNSRFNVYNYQSSRDVRHLHWKRKEEKRLFDCPFFYISSAQYLRDDGRAGEFFRFHCSDWVNVCALHQNSQGEPCLVMVRQFRHGCDEVALEMPGGYIDKNEDRQDAALRELYEETGFRAEKIEHIGSSSPNAAFMRNKLHIFLARDLQFDNTRQLDTNEVIDVELVPIALLEKGALPEFLVNGIMAIAWYFFAARMKKDNKDYGISA